MAIIAVINGPNLNLLGEREPHIYGDAAWEEIREALVRLAKDHAVDLEFFQSNHEGALIDYLQSLRGRANGLIINPGALTHYSYSIRDALATLEIPKIEVHITNIHARERWRSVSVVSSVVDGVVTGLGMAGYSLSLRAMIERI